MTKVYPIFVKRETFYTVSLVSTGDMSVATTAQINATANVTAVAAITVSQPVIIHKTVTINPDTRDAMTPRAVKRFQKKDNMTAGENEQPIPAHAKWTIV